MLVHVLILINGTLS